MLSHWKYHLVLDVIVYPAAAVTLLLYAVWPGKDVPQALLGGALGFSTFFLTALLRPGGLGGGDVKLAALIGLVLGFPAVLWALAWGIVAGGVTALALALTAHWQRGSQMPYAPFLCLGAVAALLYDPRPLLFSLR